MTINSALGAGVLLGLVACKTESIQERAEEARRTKPVCVVLSVGAEKGLAHIGVLNAMKARGIEPKCVFGNSMGALIGGLYAARPQRELKESYRSLMAAYVEQTKADKEEAAAWTFIVSMVLGVPPIEAGLGSTAVAAAVYERDHKRFVNVLDRQLEGTTIQLLPIQFATWHETLQQGPTTVTVTAGKLAEAIGDSSANPMLFPDVEVRPGARFDPGADRVSAVPLDDACRLRPDAHFIVSNVTGGPLYLSAAMTCSYEEIWVDLPGIDARKAFAGEGTEFEGLVSSGFAAAEAALAGNKARFQSSRVEGVRDFSR